MEWRQRYHGSIAPTISDCSNEQSHLSDVGSENAEFSKGCNCRKKGGGNQVTGLL